MNILEEDEEKLAVDQYFEDININETLSLHDLLFDYVSKTNICKIKHRNGKDLLFSQIENGILYRGHIKVMYLDYTWFKNLNKCLYITHVIISPRRGKFLNRDLKILLNELNIDSVYIESILSDKVLDSFVSNGWIKDNNSVMILK